jgi:hypothetical protein
MCIMHALLLGAYITACSQTHITAGPSHMMAMIMHGCSTNTHIPECFTWQIFPVLPC